MIKRNKNFNLDNLIQEFKVFKIKANYFWKPLHLQKPYQNSLKTDLTSLNDIQERILILPSSPTLKIEEQEKVIGILKSFFR